MSRFHTGLVVYHAAHGEGRVVRAADGQVIVNFIRTGVKTFTSTAAESELADTPFPGTGEESMDEDRLKTILREVLVEEGLIGRTRLGDKWSGGEVILKPGSPGLKEKSIPIDIFFKKIVMIRDRLRVLEQQINASDQIPAPEKLNFQQYITRCYGTLTSLNVLFAEREDWFVGMKGED